jgi:hypothetical protein
MTLEARFSAALNALESFYGDTVQAKAFDGPQTSSTKPGSRILAVPPESKAILNEWRFQWRNAKGDEGRQEVVRDMEAEYENRLHSPSLKVEHRQMTLEWKQAIGTCTLPAKQVARMYCIGLSTVYKYRKEYA